MFLLDLEAVSADQKLFLLDLEVVSADRTLFLLVSLSRTSELPEVGELLRVLPEGREAPGCAGVLMVGGVVA